MLNNEQAIFAIRKIYPQITPADHGSKYWVLRMMERGTNVQLSTAEIYTWTFDFPRPTPEEIQAAWNTYGHLMTEV